MRKKTNQHQMLLWMWLCIVIIACFLAVSIATPAANHLNKAYNAQQEKGIQHTEHHESGTITIPSSLITLEQTVPKNNPSEISPTTQQQTPPETTLQPVLPDGFVDVSLYVASLQVDLRYFSENNFLGTRVDGYLAERAILTKDAAIALQSVAEVLKEQGFGIVFHDGYRPKQAVAHFVRWAQDESDLKTKADYYPELEKNSLIPSGYIAKRSAHSKGSTIDLTLYDLTTGALIDMGCPIDFFGEIAHHDSNLTADVQNENRTILKTAMENAGFKPYHNEWWHYQLINEPFPDTYFDFPVQ